MLARYNNILPKSVLNHLQKDIFSDRFPWYSVSLDYSRGKKHPLSFHWTHSALMQDDCNSSICKMLQVTSMFALESVGENVDKILRIRIGLHQITPQPFVGSPHVDFPVAHKVALIYLNNSDGDTILYNEKFDIAFTNKLDSQQYFEQKLDGKVTEMERVAPEENKMILFDGLHYHSSSSPVRAPRRFVINIDYL